MPAVRDVEKTLRLARLDLNRGRYIQAVDSYAEAADAAAAIDDTGAWTAARSEGALAQLRAGDAAGARDTAARLRQDLTRRNMEVPAFTLLVEAAAYLALEQPGPVQRLVDPLTAAADAAVAIQAWYLSGRAAALENDVASLRRAIQALGSSPSSAAGSNAKELHVRLDLASGNPTRALGEAEELIELRRQEADPAAVGDALVLAGDAAARTGQTTLAGDFYLRAARNALARDRPDLAKEYLRAAERQNSSALAPDLAELRSRLPAEDASAPSG